MTLTEHNGLRILTAKEGHTIFRNSDEQNFSQTFYLGKNDSPENFTEITIQQAEAKKQAAEENKNL